MKINLIYFNVHKIFFFIQEKHIFAKVSAGTDYISSLFLK